MVCSTALCWFAFVLVFTCAGGFASTEVTGSIIGEYENKCETNTSTKQTIEFGD